MDVVMKPAGYEPWKNESPPARGSFVPLVLVGAALLIVLGGGCGFVIAKGTQLEPTPTVAVLVEVLPTEEMSPTLDDWALTGTAMLFAEASPTQDYCAWLTPTATPTATALFTPDPWQATGTAIFYLTNTPTPRIEPSATTPRSWCDFQTATLTPLPLWRETEAAQSLASATAVPPTETPRPPTSVPQIPVIPTNVSQPLPSPLPPIVLPTLAPPIVLPTATRVRKTKTPTLTATLTYMPTATASETPTLVSTASPFLQIKSADCASAYPSFGVDNFGGDALNVYWAITLDSGEIVANGIWEIFPMGSHAMAFASAWEKVPGIYLLVIYQQWNQAHPILTAQVSCGVVIAPTSTPTPTETLLPETTEEFTPTPVEILTLTPTSEGVTE